MHPLHRVFWLLTLCAFVSGCSGYRPAALPNDDSATMSGAAPADEVDTVAVGSVVRVTTTAGEAYSGKVAGVTDEALVLKPAQAGRDERVIAARDIETVSVKRLRRFVKITVETAAIMGVAFVAMLLVADATTDDIYSPDEAAD